MFTGKSSANRNTSGSSATDMEMICLLIILACVFLDQENSSMARYTLESFVPYCLYDALMAQREGPEGPREKGPWLFSGSSIFPKLNLYSEMNLYM